MNHTANTGLNVFPCVSHILILLPLILLLYPLLWLLLRLTCYPASIASTCSNCTWTPLVSFLNHLTCCCLPLSAWLDLSQSLSLFCVYCILFAWILHYGGLIYSWGSTVIGPIFGGGGLTARFPWRFKGPGWLYSHKRERPPVTAGHKELVSSHSQEVEAFF